MNMLARPIKTPPANLGMEAIYEFDVNMPVTVAVSSDGTSVHNTGLREW